MSDNQNTEHSNKKKIWQQTVSLPQVECPKISLDTLTGLFGYSRQSFYSHKDDNDFAEDALESLIAEKATEYRNDNPGLGCTKLYIIIKQMFEEPECMPNRDIFIEIYCCPVKLQNG